MGYVTKVFQFHSKYVAMLTDLRNATTVLRCPLINKRTEIICNYKLITFRTRVPKETDPSSITGRGITWALFPRANNIMSIP